MNQALDPVLNRSNVMRVLTAFGDRDRPFHGLAEFVGGVAGTATPIGDFLGLTAERSAAAFSDDAASDRHASVWLLIGLYSAGQADWPLATARAGGCDNRRAVRIN